MKITRRAAIIGAGAVSIVRPAMAADAAWAINLDGSAALHNTSPSALGFPASSSKVTVSYCYRAAKPLQNAQAVILQVEGHTGCDVQLAIQHADLGSGNFLSAVMSDDTSCNSRFAYQSAPGKLPGDGSWHQVVMSLDSSALTVSAMIDGVAVPNANTGKQTAFTAVWSDAYDVWIGGLGTNSLNFTGDLAQIWLAVGVAANLGDRTVAGRFWNYRLGMPQKFSGAGAEVISANPEVFPQINLTGPAGVFNRNGASANWTLWSRADKAPFAYVGSVTTATSDPWEDAIGVAVRRG